MIKIIESANKPQILPFILTIFVYFSELYLFFLDYISSFFFWGMLVLLVILWAFFIFGIRKTQIAKRTILLPFVASVFLLLYELPIIQTEGNHYVVYSYVPPEELIKNSGIYLLPVHSTDIEINGEEVLDEQAFRDSNNHILIFDIVKATNINRYASKTTEIFKLVGFNLEVNYFKQMSVNVKAYLNSSNPAVDEYFSRSNLGGNSAGLALVLASLIEQAEFKNDIPIGVTGAISKSGKVIEIGLVKEKVLSANKIGLPYIILPIGNLEEGNEVVKLFNLPIEVIGVENVDDAIEQIDKLNRDK